MRVRIASACCALFLIPLSIVAADSPTDDAVVHGTINIALGNKNGLVVLTDSMVTAIQTAGHIQEVEWNGQKQRVAGMLQARSSDRHRRRAQIMFSVKELAPQRFQCGC